MQVVVAEAVAADIIVTRNLRDFSGSPVAAISPEEFLIRYNGRCQGAERSREGSICRCTPM